MMKNINPKVEPIIKLDEFSEIYEAYYERVFKYIRYRVDDQHITEELCSQVFEKIILNYSNFSGDKTRLNSWVFTIAKNVITDYYRKNKKIFYFSLDYLSNDISFKKSPDDFTLDKEKNSYLFKALKKLSKKERSVISFKYGAELKNTEIAELMGLKESNVGVILYRSLKKLKKILDKEGFDYE